MFVKHLFSLLEKCFEEKSSTFLAFSLPLNNFVVGVGPTFETLFEIAA